MNQLPTDPMIALSYVNTMLRDTGDSLEELCASLDTDATALKERFAAIGYAYDPDTNRFR